MERILLASVMACVLSQSHIALGPAPSLKRPGATASDETQAPSSSTEKMDEILKQIRELRHLVESQIEKGNAAPVPVRLPDVEGPTMGHPDAPLTMVEFSDLQCPFCRRYYIGAFEDIRRDYIETGKLRYVAQDFPLDFHAGALPAARAARCAGEQGHFWEMRLALARKANLDEQAIRDVARSSGLSVSLLDKCIASNRSDGLIERNKQRAAAIGITGTPTFVIGRTTEHGLEGVMLVGALPYQEFRSKFEELLSSYAKTSARSREQ